MWTVLLKEIKAGLGQEVGNFAQIIETPPTAKARRISEDRLAQFVGFPVDDIVDVVYAPAAKQ